MLKKAFSLLRSSPLRKLFNFAYFTFFIGIGMAIPVYAYIDPATTAMITQILAGIFISLGVAFGVFRRNLNHPQA